MYSYSWIWLSIKNLKKCGKFIFFKISIFRGAFDKNSSHLGNINWNYEDKTGYKRPTYAQKVSLPNDCDIWNKNGIDVYITVPCGNIEDKVGNSRVIFYLPSPGSTCLAK